MKTRSRNFTCSVYIQRGTTKLVAYLILQVNSIFLVVIMRKEYNFYLFLIQTTAILLSVNFITASLLEKLTEMTGSESQSTDKAETPKKETADILSMGQYFQDIFSEHLAPLKIEFGHVCENPSEWEQRFERKDFDSNRHSGKIKWGNRKGEYGEQYWDLNH